MTVILRDLLDASKRDAEAKAAEAAKRASEQEHTDLRNDRRAATLAVKDLFGIDLDPNDWTRLPAAEGHQSRTVLLPFDDDPTVAFAYRQRSYTQGGAILTVMAQPEDTAEAEDWLGDELDALGGVLWVASVHAVRFPYNLAEAVADARARANDYVEQVKRGQETQAPTGEPRYSVTARADTPAELGAALFGEVLALAVANDDSVQEIIREIVVASLPVSGGGGA